MTAIDLNCDLGEGVGDDAALFTIVSSANVACGFHAGDAQTMLASCRLAVANGVAVGAHPSYPDREGFGRRDMDRDADALVADMLAQLGALAAIARVAGTRVRYVKPHGALYNRIAVDPVQAGAVAAAIAAFDGSLPVLGPSGSAIEAAAHAAGLGFRREAFVDRAYRADGSLAPRALPGAVLDDADAIARRAVQLATTGRIRSLEGTELTIAADSLCLHGDTPGAPHIARAVRAALIGAGVAIEAFA